MEELRKDAGGFHSIVRREEVDVVAVGLVQSVPA